MPVPPCPAATGTAADTPAPRPHDTTPAPTPRLGRARPARLAAPPRAGGNDRLSTETDVEYLRESLRAGVVVRTRDEPSYEHLDFIWGVNAWERLYADVMAFLAEEQESADAAAPAGKAARRGRGGGGDGGSRGGVGGDGAGGTATARRLLGR